MAPRAPEVRVKLDGLAKYQAVVASGGAQVEKAIKQWAYIYRGYAQRRFVRESRGGGAWPPLKSARKRGSVERAAVLRDTGTLFAALTPSFTGRPGQFQERIPFGVRVGFGGPARHPGAPMTVANLAEIHHRGLGVVPVRTLLDEPDHTTVVQMEAAMKKALDDLGRETDST